MKISFLFLLLGVVCAALPSAPSPCAAARNHAEVGEIHIDQDRQNLEVSFRISNCFTADMEEAVLSGVETTFKILLVLEKPGFPLFQQKLVDVVLDHTIKYDRINNEFQVTRSQNQEVLTTTDFEEAKKWMSEVNDLPLIPMWRLDKDSEYRLRVKAELSKVHLPLFFRYIFYFVSLWDFETAWHEQTLTVK